MSNPQQRLTDIGAGILRLWTELVIIRGKRINSIDLVSEARRDHGPIQPGTPMGIIYDKGIYPLELARLMKFFGVANLEELERIGSGDFQRLAEVVSGWELGPGLTVMEREL